MDVTVADDGTVGVDATVYAHCTFIPSVFFFSPYDVNVTIADGGTVDVDATVYTDIRLTLDKEDDNETFNYNDVRVTLKNAIRSGDLHSLAIEPDDKFWFYGELQLNTKNP